MSQLPLRDVANGHVRSRNGTLKCGVYGLLLVVVVLNPDAALIAVVVVAAVVSMFFSPQLMLAWTRWWAGHR